MVPSSMVRMIVSAHSDGSVRFQPARWAAARRCLVGTAIGQAEPQACGTGGNGAVREGARMTADADTAEA